MQGELFLTHLVSTEDAASRCYSVPLHFEIATAAKDGPNSSRRSRSRVRKGTQPCMSISQRKEMHNSKERERRRKIRLCCDQLNTLVPFCDSNSDKVTTLQGAVAFLRYISETYGDALKEVQLKMGTVLTEHKLLMCCVLNHNNIPVCFSAGVSGVFPQESPAAEVRLFF
uniref:BHLH domain-containing protein n=1 Tax=Salarias fasciatus TaxID=181472 RepID=A0A672J952_SALFA